MQNYGAVNFAQFFFLEHSAYVSHLSLYTDICKKLASLQLCVRTMWWYQSSKTAKIIQVTLDGAMHMASYA